MAERTQELMRSGWAPVEFDLSQSEREEFARLSYRILEMPMDDPQVEDAFSLTLRPGLVCDNNPTFFGISEAINSDDDKFWIHGGYQTKSIVESKNRGVAHTAEATDYFDGLSSVLRAVEKCARLAMVSTFDDGFRLSNLLLTPDEMSRIILIRSVIYRNLGSFAIGHEVIESHMDLGIASMQFYETHSGYLRGSAYRANKIEMTVDADRRAYSLQRRSAMRPIEYDEETQAAFFYGAGLVALNETILRGDNNDLPPAGFHAGFRPDPGEENQRAGDWLPEGIRIALIGFMQPPLGIVDNINRYHIPNLAACRPLHRSFADVE